MLVVYRVRGGKSAKADWRSDLPCLNGRAAFLEIYTIFVRAAVEVFWLLIGSRRTFIPGTLL